MNSIDQIIFIYLIFFAFHCIIYLLYQFEILKIRDKSMICWIRVMDIFETVFLVTIHISTFSTRGSYGLGIYYALNIALLLLQFIFADFGFGRKILDFFWIGFYVLFFLVDVCQISLAEIVAFITSSEDIKAIHYLFDETIIGKLIVGVATPILRTVILEALHRSE